MAHESLDAGFNDEYGDDSQRYVPGEVQHPKHPRLSMV
jgi:hypothetical protein